MVKSLQGKEDVSKVTSQGWASSFLCSILRWLEGFLESFLLSESYIGNGTGVSLSCLNCNGFNSGKSKLWCISSLYNHSEHRKVEPGLFGRLCTGHGFCAVCIYLCILAVSIRAHIKWPTKSLRRQLKAQTNELGLCSRIGPNLPKQTLILKYLMLLHTDNNHTDARTSLCSFFSDVSVVIAGSLTWFH